MSVNSHKLSASALLLIVLLFPCHVLGHILPERSEPKVGATVAAPQMVRIWFDGTLRPALSSIIVKDASGKRVDKGDGRVNAQKHNLLETSVVDLKPGTYKVFWKAVAHDGHRTAGDFTFKVR